LDYHQANIFIKASPILPNIEGQVSNFNKFTSAHIVTWSLMLICLILLMYYHAIPVTDVDRQTIMQSKAKQTESDTESKQA
jgi:hypothetical protein